MHGTNCLIGCIFVLLSSAGANASDPTPFTPRGVTISKELIVAAPPDEAWNAFTGDVSAWWDHKFSEKPVRLEIDRVPGGGFWEIFDKEGHGVKHAEVIYADPGKILKLRGPLGFSGKALDIVHTFRFTPDAGGTKISLEVNAMGQLEDGDIAAMNAVWDHFLIERFQQHIASGKHRK